MEVLLKSGTFVHLSINLSFWNQFFDKISNIFQIIFLYYLKIFEIFVNQTHIALFIQSNLLWCTYFCIYHLDKKIFFFYITFPSQPFIHYYYSSHLLCPLLFSPSLTFPVLTCPHLSCSHLSSPLLSSPSLTSPVLTSPVLTSPVLTSPVLTSPVLTFSHLSCPHLLSPLLFSPLLFSPSLTSPIFIPLYLPSFYQWLSPVFLSYLFYSSPLPFFCCLIFLYPSLFVCPIFRSLLFFYLSFSFLFFSFVLLYNSGQLWIISKQIIINSNHNMEWSHY